MRTLGIGVEPGRMKQDLTVDLGRKADSTPQRRGDIEKDRELARKVLALVGNSVFVGVGAAIADIAGISDSVAVAVNLRLTDVGIPVAVAVLDDAQGILVDIKGPVVVAVRRVAARDLAQVVDAVSIAAVKPVCRLFLQRFSKPPRSASQLSKAYPSRTGCLAISAQIRSRRAGGHSKRERLRWGNG